jgi:hypothetical protein
MFFDYESNVFIMELKDFEQTFKKYSAKQMKIDIDNFQPQSKYCNVCLSSKRKSIIRLKAKGFGSQKPLKADDTEENKAENRRVDCQNLIKEIKKSLFHNDNGTGFLSERRRIRTFDHPDWKSGCFIQLSYVLKKPFKYKTKKPLDLSGFLSDLDGTEFEPFN